MELIAIIDFETTGLSPGMGDRATEVAIVLVKSGKIVDRYQSLMNAGKWLPPFIESYTGITNAMIRTAPPSKKVMREATRFVGKTPMVAHNASFDRRFWEAETSDFDCTIQKFACSMLVSRRVIPEAPNHQLQSLVEHIGITSTGRFHRALADAEMTAHLILEIEERLRRRYALRAINHDMLCRIQRTPKAKLDAAMASYMS